MASLGGGAWDVDARTARPQSLIVTVYGAFARAHDDWLPVAGLVSLLGSLSVDEQSIRGAVSRLKRRGVLTSQRRHGAAGYAISPETRRLFEVGDARVLNGTRSHPDDGWVLLAFSIPESARDLRYRLRSRLSRVGAGQVDRGLWIGPKHLLPDIALVTSDLHVQERVSVFTAEHIGYEPTPAAVRRWWDLDTLAAQYLDFVNAFADDGRRWARVRSRIDPQDAFAAYTRALTAWRPLPYRDPGLPSQLLPADWPGGGAFDLFQGLRRKLEGPASDFVGLVVAQP